MTWKSCDSKARFEEHEAGRIAAKFGQRSYFCSKCGGFHCTKSVERVHASPFRRNVDPRIAISGAIDRAKKAISELKRKGVSGPFLESAERHLAELKASRG